MSDDEHELIVRAKGGDRDAFGELIRRHQPAVVGFLMTMTRDAAIAEECAQNAFVKALRHVSRFEGRSSFRTWVCRIAWNEAKAQYRWAKARRFVSFWETDDGGGWRELTAVSEADAATLQAVEKRVDLDRALAALAPREREVTALRLEGYALAEIAAVLEISEGAVKSTLFTATRKMRERLR